jgi:hypothetical protein
MNLVGSSGIMLLDERGATTMRSMMIGLFALLGAAVPARLHGSDAFCGAAEEELLGLAARGEVERQPLGQDAVWRLSGQAPR